MAEPADTVRFPDGRSLVLASGNTGKLIELNAMLKEQGWVVRSQQEWSIESAVEDGLSFVENALIKARHAARFTRLPALGDDSGLVVDALGGAPGIHSARYAGPHGDAQANNRKLLAAMRAVPPAQRSARFYCALVLVRHDLDPAPLIATGLWQGSITEAPRGSGGFGYDPLFWVSAEACTAAELKPGVKNRLSHRGRALAALVQQLQHEHID